VGPHVSPPFFSLILFLLYPPQVGTPTHGIINFLSYLRDEWYIKYHVRDTCYGIIRKSSKKSTAQRWAGLGGHDGRHWIGARAGAGAHDGRHLARQRVSHARQTPKLVSRGIARQTPKPVGPGC
jgi:hypothetical protein